MPVQPYTYKHTLQPTATHCNPPTQQQMAQQPQPITFPAIRDALAAVAAGRKSGFAGAAASVQRLLQSWLWAHDANEECERMRDGLGVVLLTGILFVRVLHERFDGHDGLLLKPQHIEFLEQDDKSVFIPHVRSIFETGTRQPTMKQLRDILNSVMNQWEIIQRNGGMLLSERAEADDALLRQRKVRDATLACFETLLTQISLWLHEFLFSSDIHKDLVDDLDFVDESAAAVSGGAKQSTLSDTGIKYYISNLFILFRVLYVHKFSQAVPPCDARQALAAVQPFHTEASVDEFNELVQYSMLPPGRLHEYKNTFSGFYSNVSQVIYMHYPNYSTRRPVSHAEATAADAPGLHVLPSLRQLYPEIYVVHEDHHFTQGSAEGPAVLFPSSPEPLTGHMRMPTTSMPTTNNTQKGGAAALTLYNESLRARATLCNSILSSGGGAKGKGNLGDETVQKKVSEWSWLVLGHGFFLVNSERKLLLRGAVRDLMAFYVRCKALQKQ